MNKKSEVKKNKGGRPSHYNATIIEKTKYYIENYKQLGQVIPTQCGLCNYLKISEDSSIRWKKEYDEFGELLRQIELKQQQELLNNGLAGSFNSAITKLILHKHGYSERIEQSTDLTSKGEAITGIVREIVK